MTNERYIRVHWLHNLPDEPIDLWSELDDQRYETRKIEYFPDGSVGFASHQESVGGTRLGKIPIPSLSDIAKDTQFKPQVVTKDLFEERWSARHPQRAE